VTPEEPMQLSKKIRQDWAPILFFGLVVSAKTYYLIVYLSSSANLWGLLGDITHLGDYGGGAAFFLTGSLSYLLYYVTALAFDALVFVSFLGRVEAKERPQGFWENIYPLITVFLPVLGYTLLFIPAVRQMVPGYSESTLEQLRALSPIFPFYMNMAGTLIGFVGAALSIWAISYLRRSFGLRTAVRDLVTSGPYRWVRHPLYVGEIVHIFGIAILSGTPVGLYLFIVALGLQVGRARIEERKFLRTVPDYARYRKSTGFLWPRLRKGP
jgi:protein-S-isoprenylcysteine O-methyltransferase Ste14